LNFGPTLTLWAYFQAAISMVPPTIRRTTGPRIDSARQLFLLVGRNCHLRSRFNKVRVFVSPELSSVPYFATDCDATNDGRRVTTNSWLQTLIPIRWILSLVPEGASRFCYIPARFLTPLNNWVGCSREARWRRHEKTLYSCKSTCTE